MTEATTSAGFVYEVRGEGPWLVMINGIGAAHEAWAPHVDDLSRHFRCLTFDNRGVGKSPRPPGPYTTAAMADDVAAILAELGIARAHVVGASMGGAIAQELVLRHPERVDRLAIVCSWPACDRYLERCFTILKEYAEAAGREGRGWSMRVRHFLSLIAFARSDFSTSFETIAAAERLTAEAVAAGLEQPADAFIAQAEACLSHDTRHRLVRIAAPTLVLAGDQDAFTPLPLSQALAAAIPGAMLSVMEGCGHVMFYERPKEFTARLIEFFDQEREDGR